ncbi:MAG: GntR family transcriptional regulator, partial [Firmicutes bacterium]|nr:GntR family transcriptional regulator [Bacillota bacterium]
MAKNTDHQFKYTQLYEILVEKITCGEWKPNERIPTEQELCRRYDLSRITVRDALALLTKDGYIYRKQGKGSFVAIRP